MTPALSPPDPAPAPAPVARRIVRLAAAALLVVLLTPAPGRAAPATPAAPGGPRTGLVRVEYVAPKNPAHRAMYDHLRDRKALDPFAEVLGSLRLPRPLTLRFAGCDGEANAWYDTDDDTVTFCYELVAEFEAAADGAAKYGIPRDDAVEGALAFIVLHESGHAVFHLLKVPLLGREEDAADHVAAFVLLRAGPGIARRAIGGAAWMYKHDASSRTVDESDLADVHGLDAQRLYNVLCMAYGSDPASYGAMVEKGYLPKERAEGCRDEYEQVAYAVKRLISKSLDPKAAQRTRERLKRRQEAPAPAAAGTSADAPAPRKP